MIRSFYLSNSVYSIGGAASIIFIVSHFFPAMRQVAVMLLLFLVIAIVIDAILLYATKGITARRELAERLSIGDDNNINIFITSRYGFPVRATLIDEIPVQFQDRKWRRKVSLPSKKETAVNYTLRPVARGEYTFNQIILFVRGPLSLVKRRYSIDATKMVKVYPSYIQMRRFQILAVTNNLQEVGVKQIRRLGHSMEFEQIKEYVRGDDYRTINWKATGRKGDLMVNNYTDERSQQIYCLVSKSRGMKMPFNGLTLLDYAINSSLVLSNVALAKQDKAGLITFAEGIDSFVQADKKTTQISTILETLYRQRTNFLEADFEKLYSTIRHRITNRSLLVLFTNFESMESLQREMPALKKIAHYHLLLVVFFVNTELKAVTEKKPSNLEGVYIKTIAEKFTFEKKLMVKELRKNGILSILSAPEELTINAINKYLELKNRASI